MCISQTPTCISHFKVQVLFILHIVGWESVISCGLWNVQIKVIYGTCWYCRRKFKREQKTAGMHNFIWGQIKAKKGLQSCELRLWTLTTFVAWSVFSLLVLAPLDLWPLPLWHCQWAISLTTPSLWVWLTLTSRWTQHCPTKHPKYI